MRHWFIALLIVLAACAPAANADGPPDIEVGRSVCERCGMIIEDVRFAAGYVDASGLELVFDEVGGMLDWATSGAGPGASMWVHDFSSLDWIRAEDATYVRGSHLHSPMGFAIAAFSTGDRAHAHARTEGGTVVGWEELLLLAADDSLLSTPHDQPDERTHDHQEGTP